MDPIDPTAAQILLQFPEGKSLFNVDWIGVLSRRNKVSSEPQCFIPKYIGKFSANFVLLKRCDVKDQS